jgi:hypothetical protein
LATLAPESSIERTSSSRLRLFAAAAHAKRLGNNRTSQAR